MPKISVIVPVYRAEKFIRDCLDSILSQTFGDFELILVDDGSPDGSGKICDEYAAREERVSVIHQTNQGQAAARNHALAQAVGEWICFVDSDDLIHPQMLERLLEAAEAEEAQISMCPMLEATEVPETFWTTCTESREGFDVGEQMLLDLYDREEYPAWVVCAKLIRRELVQGHLFCPGRVYEDNEAACHWVCGAKRLARVEQKLYFYRTNPESTTQRQLSQRNMDYLWALEQITRFYGELGYHRMRQRFVARYVEAMASGLYGAQPDRNRRKVVRRIEKNARKFFREEKIRLEKEQFELLLDAAHPALVRLYWPMEGVSRTLREGGIGALMGKLREKMERGEGQ